MSKIFCECGKVIRDGTDNQSWKAYFISDQDWGDVFDAIEKAFKESGPNAAEKEAACSKLLDFIGDIKQIAYQCSECGRLFLADQDFNLWPFVRASDDVPCEMFRRRPSQ